MNQISFKKIRILILAFCSIVAMHSNSKAITSTFTITWKCDNGNTGTKTATETSTDNGITWTQTSLSITDCNGKTTTYGVKGSTGTDLGTLPTSTLTFYTSGGVQTNITGATDTITAYPTSGELWNITGYNGTTKTFSLDCDSNANITLTIYSGGNKIANGPNLVVAPGISGLIARESAKGLDVSFTLMAPSTITLQLYDMLGQMVDSFEGEATFQPGPHDFILSNTAVLTKGAYILRVTAGSITSSQKIIIGN